MIQYTPTRLIKTSVLLIIFRKNNEREKSPTNGQKGPDATSAEATLKSETMRN